MKLAQQEIKATVTVNTSDLGSKPKDEDTNGKDAQTHKKGQGELQVPQVFIMNNCVTQTCKSTLNKYNFISQPSVLQ